MNSEVSPLQKMRRLVQQAATHGGRVDLLTYIFMEDGKPTRNTRMIIGDGEELQELDDIKGPLTELFIEQTGRRVRPESLVSDVFARPTRKKREQYYDVKSVTVPGRDVRLGVEVVIDDAGEQRRTFFAEGPTLIQRWARSMDVSKRVKRNFLPPDSGDKFN